MVKCYMIIYRRRKTMSNLYEGKIIEVKKGLFVGHPGIIVWNGFEWNVIHNSPKSGKVIMSSLSEFAEGRKIYSSNRYQSNLPTSTIAHRARCRLGKSYSLASYNCQHFVTDACGITPKSHDLHAFAFVCVIGFMGLAFRR